MSEFDLIHENVKDNSQTKTEYNCNDEGVL